jgi:PhnB protein
MTPEIGLLKGNATSIMLNCSTEAEVRELFDALSKKGQIHHLIETTFVLRYLAI